MRRLTALLGTLLALALVAGACGDDGGGGAASVDDPLVQAIVDDMLAEGDMGASQDQAECFATRVVGGIGQGRLAELGVSADNIGELDEIDWTQGEAELIVDEMFDCTDVEDEFSDQLAVEGMTDEQNECLAGAFGEDKLKEFFVANLRGEEPENFFSDVAAAMDECGINPLAG